MKRNLSYILSLIFCVSILSGIGCINSISVNAATETKGIFAGEYYYIKLAGTNCYLDVANGSTANGANVLLWTWHGSDNQQWKFVQKSNGSYVLVPKHATGKRLDVGSSNNTNNSNVDIYNSTNDTDQEWQVPMLYKVKRI